MQNKITLRSVIELLADFQSFEVYERKNGTGNRVSNTDFYYDYEVVELECVEHFTMYITVVEPKIEKEVYIKDFFKDYPFAFKQYCTSMKNSCIKVTEDEYKQIREFRPENHRNNNSLDEDFAAIRMLIDFVRKDD